ncbi:integrase core domain-containing protein [Streptomyces sp. NPDC008121]|uniref:integrase core domain-containing protein n=1 Tax=Streptomyces sp. NPDC008121 TaxID=3364809 RepID=UPI0036EDFC43
MRRLHVHRHRRRLVLLAAVIDIAPPRVAGWATVVGCLRTEPVADALTAACRTRQQARSVIWPLRPRLPVHQPPAHGPGNGSRHRAADRPHRSVLGQHARRIVLPTLRNELLDSRPWPSRAAARSAISEWIQSWYNVPRLHSSLGYRNPAEYETALAA